MGLEWHGTSGPYFYRKRWESGRVVSEYLGAGAVAQVLASYDAAERLEAKRQRAAFRAVAAGAEDRAALLLQAETWLRHMVAAVLVATGHYQHKRQWRKRAMTEPNTSPTVASSRMERRGDGLKAFRAALATVPPAPSRKRIDKREQAEVEQLRRQAMQAVIDAYPEIWASLYHFVSSAEKRIIDQVTDDANAALILQTTLRGIRRDLGYLDAPMLERLVIEQIALAWLDLDLVQQHYARSTLGNHGLHEGAYWNKRLSGAQARYLRATETLARVRRLAMPMPLQVNIGGQQVNVAGVGQTDG
jgi:hypothetical protein